MWQQRRRDWIGRLAWVAGCCIAPALSAAPLNCPDQRWLRCVGLTADNLSGSARNALDIRDALLRWKGELETLRGHVELRVAAPVPAPERYGSRLELDLPATHEEDLPPWFGEQGDRRGLRYVLGTDTDAGPEHRWAVGAYLRPDEDGGHEALTLAPQIRTGLQTLSLLPGHAELRIDYAPWERSRWEDRHDRALQMSVHWSF